MARKKTEPTPKPEPKPKTGTPPVQMRLTPDDLAAIDRIAAHYHLTNRADAVRLAVYHVAANMGPITAVAVPKKKS